MGYTPINLIHVIMGVCFCFFFFRFSLKISIFCKLKKLGKKKTAKKKQTLAFGQAIFYVLFFYNKGN